MKPASGWKALHSAHPGFLRSLEKSQILLQSFPDLDQNEKRKWCIKILYSLSHCLNVLHTLCHSFFLSLFLFLFFFPLLFPSLCSYSVFPFCLGSSLCPSLVGSFWSVLPYNVPFVLNPVFPECPSIFSVSCRPFFAFYLHNVLPPFSPCILTPFV